MFTLSTIIFVFMTTQECFSQEDPLVIQVVHGKIRGKLIETTSGKRIHAFLGIPYAEPPLGKLRFKPPLDITPWDDTLNTTSLSDSCFQRDIPILHYIPALKRWNPTTPFSEDCLKLNVWVPDNGTPREILPVIVFIHGGKFSTGSTSVPAYEGLTLSSEENVIVVTFNYRLNSLGFLNMYHPDAPGNVGFLDQVLALKWVKENIKYFGGDSESITVFGHSAGAVSVGFHLISKESSGLFKRAVIQSGGATSDWIIQDRNTSLYLARELAEGFTCPKTENVTETIQCLRNVDALDLVRAEPMEGYELSTFRPTIDGRFLTEMPKMLFQNGNFSAVDVLIGVTRDEGTYFMIWMNPTVYLRDNIKLERRDTVEFIQTLYPNAEKHIYKAIELFYTNLYHPDDPDYNLFATNSLIGDVNFVCSINEIAQIMALKGNTVYKYMFAYRSEGDPAPKWLGTYHGSDLIYTFGEPVKVPKKYTEDEINFSRRLMKYWANFARTGNPNFPGSNDTPWPRYTPKWKEYFVLAPNTKAVGHMHRDRVCTFWNDVFPHITNVTLHW